MQLENGCSERSHTSADGWRARTSPAARHAARLSFLPAAFVISVLFLSGCHGPNDPNVNPKARWALMMSAERSALREFDPSDYYERRETTLTNPATGRTERLHVYTLREQPQLPAGFVIAYDPVERRTCIRRAIDAYRENLSSLPRGARKATTTQPTAAVYSTTENP